MRQATLSDIESTGVCRTPTLEMIARGLGITAADIYADVPKPATGAGSELCCEAHRETLRRASAILHAPEPWPTIALDVLEVIERARQRLGPPERDHPPAPVYRKGDHIGVARKQGR